MEMSRHRSNIIGSIALIAWGVFFPGIADYFGVEASLVTMQIPVLLAGFLLPMNWAVLCAFAIPCLCTAVLGIPALFPALPLTVCEMVSYAAFANLLYISFNEKILPSLLMAMLLGRTVLFCAASIYSWLAEAFNAFSYTFSIVAVSWPGMLLQVALIPTIVKAAARIIQPMKEPE